MNLYWLQVPENSSFFHEPIIWRLHELIQQVNINRFYHTKTNAVSIDPIIEIGVLNIFEVRLKVSMTMSPTQRPKGVLEFWSSLMTALGNMEMEDWISMFSNMWSDLILKTKNGGLDVIQTYVFWNGHETSPGKILELQAYEIKVEVARKRTSLYNSAKTQYQG